MARYVALALLVVGQAAGQSPSQPVINLAPIVPASIRLLDYASVRDDVGLSPRQKEKFDSLQTAWSISAQAWVAASIVWITPEIARTAIDQHTRDFLTKELTAAQRKRLEQIEFQLKEREYGAHAAFSMAAGDLGLRSDQMDDVKTLKGLRVEEITKHVISGERFVKVKGKVEATNGDTFEKMTEMLSRAQRERLTELKGKGFGGKIDYTQPTTKLSPMYPPGLFGMYDLELRYVTNPFVRSELKITDAQAKNLDSAESEWLRDVKDGRIVPSMIDSQHQLTERTLAEHLTREQRTRFGQIMMQRRALVSPEAMCGHPAAVAALKLSPIQIGQLRDGKLIADVLSSSQMKTREQLLGTPFVLPKIFSDPYVSVVKQNQIDTTENSYARSFLLLANRIKLDDKQVAKLRELAEDEPKIIELIERELSLADTPPVVGSGRCLTAVGAVTDIYKVAVEEQCWNVLDAAQQSLARKILGGSAPRRFP